MTKITIFLSDYLDQQELSIMDFEFFTNGTIQSRKNMFDPVPKLTYAKTAKSLPVTSHRFFLFDEYGIIYTKELPKEELEEILPTLLREPLKELPLEMPSRFIMADMIQKAREKGFYIHSYKQTYVEAWDNIDSYAFSKIIAENADLEEPYRDPVNLLTIEEHQGDLFFVDKEKHPIFQLRDSKTTYSKDMILYFDISNKDGQVILKKVTYFRLLPVLYLLMEGFSLTFIRNLFLRSNEDDEGGTIFSNLHYICYETTQKLPVKDAGDLYKSHHADRDRDNPIYDYEFRFWSESDYQPSEYVILTEEAGFVLSESHLYDDTQERERLSELLVNLAASIGCDIYQTDRFFHNRTVLDNIEYVDGKFEQYNRTLLHYNTEYMSDDEIPLRRVYDLVNQQTGYYELRELPKDEFITHLLICVFEKNKHLESGIQDDK